MRRAAPLVALLACLATAALRVGDRGRFRFEWVPRRSQVGAGRWTVVARMRCESGDDGSPVPTTATTPIRIRR